MKTAIIALLLLTSCSGRMHASKSTSEVKQKKFVTMWTVTGIIVIAWAIQDNHEEKNK